MCRWPATQPARLANDQSCVLKVAVTDSMLDPNVMNKHLLTGLIALAGTTAVSVPALAAQTTNKNEDKPQAAIAVVHGTKATPDAHAVVRFTPTQQGLAYTTEAHGLTPGKHGYHLHIYGDCSAADATSAGTHYNLKGSSLNPPADIDRITGNLGELVADANGDARDKGLIDNAKLKGKKSIIGRAVIIHEKPNDASQPPIGAAGSRQACGVIGIADPASISQPAMADESNAADAEKAKGESAQ